MRAYTGNVFIVFFDMQRVRVKSGLLHHGLRQGLRLHHIEIEIFENLKQQGKLGLAEVAAVGLNQADVVGIADFLPEQLGVCIHGVCSENSVEIITQTAALLRLEKAYYGVLFLRSGKDGLAVSVDGAGGGGGFVGAGGGEQPFERGRGRATFGGGADFVCRRHGVSAGGGFVSIELERGGKRYRPAILVALDGRAVFVFTSVFLAPKIGIANTMFLFILGQLAGSMLIDHFGLIQMPLRPLQWWKFVGMAVMLAGVALFVFGERWFKA